MSSWNSYHATNSDDSSKIKKTLICFTKCFDFITALIRQPLSLSTFQSNPILSYRKNGKELRLINKLMTSDLIMKFEKDHRGLKNAFESLILNQCSIAQVYLFQSVFSPKQFAVDFSAVNMKVLITVLLVAIAQQCFAQQDTRFIVNIVHRQNDVSSLRCVASAFTARHVLTTATCIDGPGIAEHLVVQLRTFSVSAATGISEQVRDCK